MRPFFFVCLFVLKGKQSYPEGCRVTVMPMYWRFPVYTCQREQRFCTLGDFSFFWAQPWNVPASARWDTSQRQPESCLRSQVLQSIWGGSRDCLLVRAPAPCLGSWLRSVAEVSCSPRQATSSISAPSRRYVPNPGRETDICLTLREFLPLKLLDYWSGLYRAGKNRPRQNAGYY